MIVKSLLASGRQSRTRLAFGRPLTRHGTNRRWCLARHAFPVIQSSPSQLDGPGHAQCHDDRCGPTGFRACVLNISVTQNLEITSVHLHGTSSKNGGFMKLISLATGFRKMGVLKQLKAPGVCRHCFASTQCPIYRGADCPLRAPSNPPRALTSPGCWAVAVHSACGGTPSLHNTNSPASKGAW